ncbi:hypothetical protein [Pelagibius marinus]|uniref:hypothetical protein n=1 Tax=Pelagibius marinus TaxID=2762760 RepID=UPI001872B2A4|nr:hypothetical protein [Pelagibius marinus]
MLHQIYSWSRRSATICGGPGELIGSQWSIRAGQRFNSFSRAKAGENGFRVTSGPKAAVDIATKPLSQKPQNRKRKLQLCRTRSWGREKAGKSGQWSLGGKFVVVREQKDSQRQDSGLHDQFSKE